MNEFIEKLIGRLEEEYNYQKTKAFQEGIRVGCGEEPKMITEERCRYKNAQCFDASIQIVEELAKEYNGGWIPTSERLPDNEDYVLCWYEYYRFGSYNRMYQTYGLGYYIKQYDMWGGEVNQGQKCRVIAWKNLPAPYNPKGE